MATKFKIYSGNTDRVKNQSDCRIFTVPSKKKKKMNIFHADPSKSGKGRQCKKFTSEFGICLTYGSMDFLFLVIWFIKC